MGEKIDVPAEEKHIFTTGEAAEICKVSQQTIIRCFDSGRLHGFRVPGSRFRRIPRDELIRFMKNNDIPTEGFDTGLRRVLVVDDDQQIVELFCDALGRDGRYGRVVLPFNWWFMLVSPLLLPVVVVLATAAALTLAGPAGLALPAALAGFVLLGQRDALGPLQPAYAIFDTQVSLLRAAWMLLWEGGDGTWDVDAELREAYE
jgi:excisionase family DNA binding protein